MQFDLKFVYVSVESFIYSCTLFIVTYINIYPQTLGKGRRKNKHHMKITEIVQTSALENCNNIGLGNICVMHRTSIFYIVLQVYALSLSVIIGLRGDDVNGVCKK